MKSRTANVKLQLEKQIQRLRLDDDLRCMVLTGVRKISDEEAARLTAELKDALDRIPAAIKELLKERPEPESSGNPFFPDMLEEQNT